MVTQSEIDAAKTSRGGWTKSQLESWGVPWPPPSGWRARVTAGLPVIASTETAPSGRKRDRAGPEQMAQMRTLTAHLKRCHVGVEGLNLAARIRASAAVASLSVPQGMTTHAELAWLVEKLAGKRASAPVEPPAISHAAAQEFYQSRAWKRVRLRILIRDGRICRCCGATPDAGAVMNVDHIRSLRHFWHLRLDETNLQVLCADCNCGKGNDEIQEFPTPRRRS